MCEGEVVRVRNCGAQGGILKAPISFTVGMLRIDQIHYNVIAPDSADRSSLETARWSTTWK